MRIFNEENPRFQCFDCGAISKSSEWNKKTNEFYEENKAILPECYIENNHDMTTVGIKESNPNLPAFVCPVCESAPMADELIYVPDGEKVVVRAMSIQSDKEVALEYDIYLAEEIRPLHKLKENPIRDYSDYIEGKPFFNTVEEMKKALSKENILDFIKENHPELIKYIEGRGLFLYPSWVPYSALV